MTKAAALSRFGHRVLLLEQAPTLGGLTHGGRPDEASFTIHVMVIGHYLDGAVNFLVAPSPLAD